MRFSFLLLTAYETTVFSFTPLVASDLHLCNLYIACPYYAICFLQAVAILTWLEIICRRFGGRRFGVAVLTCHRFDHESRQMTRYCVSNPVRRKVYGCKDVVRVV